MESYRKMTTTSDRHLASDDLSARQTMTGKLARDLDKYHKQALRLGMPLTAHLIGVAALAASDDEGRSPKPCAPDEQSRAKARRGSRKRSRPPTKHADFPHLTTGSTQ